MEVVAAAVPAIKVAALSGSLRQGSFNRGLVRAGSLSLSQLCSLPSLLVSS